MNTSNVNTSNANTTHADNCPATSNKPQYTIVHHADAGQWEVRLIDSTQPDELGRVIGYASYDVFDNSILLTHTVVMKNYRGYGIASDLITTALDEIRSEGKYTVVPVCSYAQRYIDQHPEYKNLLPAKPPAPGLHFGE